MTEDEAKEYVRLLMVYAAYFRKTGEIATVAVERAETLLRTTVHNSVPALSRTMILRLAAHITAHVPKGKV